MAFTIVIEGMGDTLRAFEKLGGAFADEKVEHMLLLKAGQPLAEAVSAEAPRRTGKLKGAAIAKIGRRRAGFPSVFAAIDLKKIGEGAERSRYPYMVEYGVKAHIKRAIKGPWMYLFGYRKVRQIRSSGMAAARYFRTALGRMRGPIKANVTAGFAELLRNAAPYAESYESAGFGD